MTDPQYWEDRRLARGAGMRGEQHNDKKESTKYGVVTPAHHEIRFQDKMNGTTLLVKIFAERITLSMNGPFDITVEDLESITSVVRDHDNGCLWEKS